MTTRYQKRHYEDVAAILASAMRETDDEGKMADRYMDDTTIENLAGDFADLFAADNPNRTNCGYCGVVKGEDTVTCWQGEAGPGSHSWYDHKGLDRELFLAACGLESGPDVLAELEEKADHWEEGYPRGTG